MTYISGVDFKDAWEQKIVAVLEETSMPFIHLNHLILSKMTTGRPQDSTDVEQLQKIQEFRGGKK